MYLNCHSYYSLNYGTFSEIELLELAKANNISALAITDINNTSACLNFIRKSKDFNIKPIVGIDFRNGSDQQYVGIAKNNGGFRELNEFLSHHLHGKLELPQIAPSFKNALIIYPFEKVLLLEKETFGENEYIGISLADLRKLPFSKFARFRNRMVIQQPVTFRNKRDFNTHRLLRCIGLNILLSKLPKTEEGRETDIMLPFSELLEKYAEWPIIISNTKRIIEDCEILFGFGEGRENQNKRYFLGSKESDFERLRELCEKSLPNRYETPTEEVRSRLERELKTIYDLDFVAFFLINHDIVGYAKSNNYPHVGRGSGANSIVAYIIGITDVDPIDLDLYLKGL